MTNAARPDPAIARSWLQAVTDQKYVPISSCAVARPREGGGREAVLPEDHLVHFVPESERVALGALHRRPLVFLGHAADRVAPGSEVLYHLIAGIALPRSRGCALGTVRRRRAGQHDDEQRAETPARRVDDDDSYDGSTFCGGIGHDAGRNSLGLRGEHVATISRQTQAADERQHPTSNHDQGWRRDRTGRLNEARGDKRRQAAEERECHVERQRDTGEIAPAWETGRSRCTRRRRSQGPRTVQPASAGLSGAASALRERYRKEWPAPSRRSCRRESGVAE